MKVHLDRVRAKPAVTPLVSGGLGWFSIALGVAEIAAAGPIARALGLPPAAAWLIRGFGAREIATGVGVLSAPANPQWLMARVGGDALDLAALAFAARPGNLKRNNALAATAAVAGVTAIDAIASGRLARLKTSSSGQKYLREAA
ncbi:MAG: hypothetical protein WCY15_04450 [Phenylobacterium sp.]|jgi:hypothetical protein|uniref:hypothetical protein n=1 Tax=Phenylobacterium sp. TaxID=1871053 RepID=UPI002A35C6A0|nr:hypothetical protein [Phenylobacterium sp.]MDX9997897.1 hypothetical protein [Phenylobacterium sp.]